jgi:DNA-binding response OmpR family regulator
VDDDRVARTLMVNALRGAGYKVEQASGGVTGLDMCERNTYDLVVTDIIMPDREGTSLIVDLKRRFPTMKIVAVSGAGSTQFVDHLKMASMVGADSTIPKPFEPEEFVECVRKALGS